MVPQRGLFSFCRLPKAARPRRSSPKAGVLPALVDGDTVYVTGTRPGKEVQVWASKDLQHWDTWTALDLPGFKIFNTSICKAANKYVMMFEISEPEEQAGVPFTARFATSDDFKHWTVTPPVSATMPRIGIRLRIACDTWTAITTISTWKASTAATNSLSCGRRTLSIGSRAG